MAKKPADKKFSDKEIKQYTVAHGVDRGGTQKKDDVPKGQHPELNVESPDEGLFAFIQSTQCRRKVWATAFESEAYLKRT